MSQMVRKATGTEIVNHWVLAISCILLIITGYGFLFRIEGIFALFGSNQAMKIIHNWAGVVFSLSLLMTMANYLREALDLGKDDWEWMRMGGGYLSKKAVAVPPMGKLNTGQKLYYLAILAGGLAIIASGFAIWLVPGSRSLTQISHLVHNLAFVLFVVAVPVHVYLGTLANPGVLQIMITGTVPLDFAKKRYPKWTKELGM